MLPFYFLRIYPLFPSQCHNTPPPPYYLAKSFVILDVELKTEICLTMSQKASDLSNLSGCSLSSQFIWFFFTPYQRSHVLILTKGGFIYSACEILKVCKSILELNKRSEKRVILFVIVCYSLVHVSSSQLHALCGDLLHSFRLPSFLPLSPAERKGGKVQPDQLLLQTPRQVHNNHGFVK